MAYDSLLADRVREYLSDVAGIRITEKAMFSGLAFLVNGKMCVNISRDNLMCRFDPARFEEVAERNGYLPMVMKGKEMKGYCFVEPAGFRRPGDFRYWMELCLEFNRHAKASKKKKP
ncbi:MAG: TfoX family protein [Chitinophagaceae bacterium]|nr:MAG: TfoX family protein [Chitinophagaceae bacterium]